MTDAVLVHTQDAVAWITLNRPDAMNAINDDVRRLLPEALATADADPQVRAIVVRGAGPRAFCAGADIKEFGAAPQPTAYRQARVHHHWIAAFDRTLKPVIAAVHGHCLGGGLEIALACDIRIAATNASFGLPETGHGIIPGAGGTQRLTRVLGLGLALDLVLTGERLDAQRALAIGLVSRLASPDDLEQAAGDLARHIAARPPLAMQFAKEAVRGGADMPLADGMRLESDLSAHLLDTHDRTEAARAFQEKRPPRYTGQ